MNERVIQFRVGVVVVAATIITGIMIMLIGEGKMLMRQQYTIYLLFPQAPGVMIDTPVRKHGVLIGRVTSVVIRDEGGVRLTARIDANRNLRRDEVCLIKTATLLGDAVVEFVPTEGRGEFVQHGETIADGVVASNPVEVITNLQGNVESAIGAIEAAANEIQQLAQGANQALGANGEQIRRIVQKSEQTIDQFRATLTTVESFVGNEELKNSFQNALQDLPLMFEDVKLTLGTFRETMSGFDDIAQQAKTNLQNLDNLTRPLGQRGGQLAADIAETAGNLNAISRQFVSFSEALNNREGTLGRILYDPELYNRLNDTLLRVNRMTRRVEPILGNVNVFTDKIARDPSVLGVKGALNRRPSGTGVKYLPSLNR